MSKAVEHMSESIQQIENGSKCCVGLLVISNVILMLIFGREKVFETSSNV